MIKLPENIMEGIKSLPSLSGAAVKLLALLEDPKANANQIEGILRYDPGLTANILRMSNSAYFGLPRKVGSVRQAIVLIGWKRLNHLVMASCVNAIMDKPVPGYDLSPGELWRHSIAVSITAENLAQELNIQSSQEIFTAALLHDIGKLVLGRYVKEEFKTIEKTASGEVPFEEAERRVLGTDHAEIGAKILMKWSLPIEVVNAVRWHHDPDSAKPTTVLVDIVHIANVLCLMMGIGVGIEGLHHSPSPSATKRLGVQTSHLELVASQTLEWIKEISSNLGMGETG